MDRETQTTVVRDREPSNSLTNLVMGLLAIIGLVLLFNYFVNPRQSADQTTNQTTTTQDETNAGSEDSATTTPSAVLSAQPSPQNSASVSE